MSDDGVIDGERTGYSRHLRELLRAARKELQLSQQDVADRVARRLGKDSHSGQAIGQYERFVRHPPVDVYAAWARSVGKRLVIMLDDAKSERVAVLVHPKVAEAARALEAADEDTRGHLIALIDKLCP